MNWQVFIGALALACMPAPAMAKGTDELVEIKTGPVAIRSDRAYFLFRTNAKGISPVFMRIPTDREMTAYNVAKREAFSQALPNLLKRRAEMIDRKAAADSAGTKFTSSIPPEPSLATFNFVYDQIQNIQIANTGRPIEKGAAERSVLIEAVPGTYVFYGVGFGDSLQTCLCLGSASFVAETGRLVDLGTILIDLAGGDTPSDIPELRGETGLGASLNGHTGLWAVAIRQPKPGTDVPAALVGQPIQIAKWEAIGKFVSPLAFSINRLAPIDGVLGYDRGRVLDLATGKVADNHF
jgi:hypothetical protein